MGSRPHPRLTRYEETNLRRLPTLLGGRETNLDPSVCGTSETRRASEEKCDEEIPRERSGVNSFASFAVHLLLLHYTCFFPHRNVKGKE